MPILSAGQSVVEALRAEDVRYIFGVVGSAFLEILDAMYGRKDIQYVGCRHEQGAGFMALGYARATGQPGAKRAWSHQPGDQRRRRTRLSRSNGNHGGSADGGTGVQGLLSRA